MNTNLKKALLIFGGGLVLYWAFTKIRPIGGGMKATKSSGSSDKSFSGDQRKNAMAALQAYRAAKRNGESKQFLDELNQELAKEYGVRVYTDKATGKCIATDLGGNKIS